MFPFVLVCFETVCFGCFASIPKHRVLMFRLNRNKQKTNRNSLIGSIFCHFLQPYNTYARTFRFQSCLVNTPKYSKLCMYKYGEPAFSYSFFSGVWTHKLRFLAKLLHIPKRAKNLGFFRFFSDFFVFFVFFRFVSKQKTHPNNLKESIFGYFSENLGSFRFVAKQICLFRLFRYRFETPKQTKNFSFWFHETNRNKRETNLVSVCSGSNRNLFLFVSRTP